MITKIRILKLYSAVVTAYPYDDDDDDNEVKYKFVSTSLNTMEA